MKSRAPFSLLLPVLVALVICGIFTVITGIRWGLGSGEILMVIFFFLVTFGILILMMELFIFPAIRKIELQNTQEIAKLKKLESFRREFLGDVSHELKTPIFAIEGFIETLLDGALYDEKVNKKFLKKAQKNAERLSSLVQDILVITQIESGDLGMQMEKFNLLDLIREVMESLEHKFHRKGRNIAVNILENGLGNCRVLADELRIEQVLRNLIDNAIKYGDTNGLVTIEMLRLGEHKIAVKVHDKGPGIEPRHLPRLFERFYRVDKSRSREKGGTGLGLAICKHFIEAHGEKIWVDSVVGEGTTLTFTLKEATD